MMQGEEEDERYSNDEDKEESIIEDEYDDARERMQRYDDEVSRIRRFLQCMVILAVFWFVMLYLIVNQDQGLVIAGFVVMVMWILYMCICICGNLFVRHREEQRQIRRRELPRDDEEAGLTSTTRSNERRFRGRGLFHDNEDDNDGDLDGDVGSSFSYSFEETPERVKACQDPIPAGSAPTNGTYTAVYSAVFFHRTMRSEGKLHLEFYEAKAKNGWQIHGEAQFGKDSKVIREGFVNSRGEMYWIVRDTIHRGIFDWKSSSMYDGEFVTQDKDDNVGRIVRLELAKATFYSSGGGTGSVEMISFSSSNPNEDQDDPPGPLFT